MKNFKRHGETIDFVAGATTLSGALVMVGGVAAVALTDVANGKVGEARTEGVYELPKASATTAAQGTDAYLIVATGLITGVATGNTRIGRFWAAAVNGSAIALVKLNAV